MKKILKKGKVVLSLLLVCFMLAMSFNGMTMQAAESERVQIAYNSEQVTYSDGWSDWNNIQMYTNTVGSSVTVAFEGTGFAILGGLAQNGPIAEVNFDNGAVVEEADFFSASGTGAEGLVYEKRGLEDGEHTVTITFTDRVNDGYGGGFAALQIAVYGFEALHYQEEETVERLESATFYVDAESGDDTADGQSPDTAWKTLERLEEAGPFIAGDKILLKAGTEYHENLVLRGSGTEEAPISVDIYNGDVIGKEAGERAAIHADGQATSAVLLADVSHWNLSNLEVTNDAGNNDAKRVGVNVEITQPAVQKGFHLDNLYVHDVTGTMVDKNAKNGGIYFAVTCPKQLLTNKEAHFEDILIENCYVKDVSRTGISVGYTTKDDDSYGYGGRLPEDFISNYYHTNVVIRNNYVERSGGDAIVPMYCSAPLVEYNVSDGASQNTDINPNAMYNAAIWPWRCEDAVFQFNEAFGTILNGDGQAYDCDFSLRTIYQYNYSHDNEGGFMLVCQGESLESIIRYNISQNDMRSLFMLSNANEAVAYNNTFYIGEGLQSIVSDYGGKASMYNNILYSTGESNITGWGSNVTWDNNLYYQCDTLPSDANKITADPMFADPGKGGTAVLGNSAIDTLGGYQLQEGSPAIDAGKVMEDNGGRDYFGTVLTGTPDLGAAEYVEPEKEFTVTVPESAEGGSVTLAGDATVKEGESCTFTVTAAEGYEVKDVLVNGVSVGKVTEYTIESVEEDVIVEVVFEKKAEEKPPVDDGKEEGTPDEDDKEDVTPGEDDKEEGAPGEDDKENGAADEKEDTKPSEKPSVNTSDSNSVLGMLVCMFACCGIMAVVIKRKEA